VASKAQKPEVKDQRPKQEISSCTPYSRTSVTPFHNDVFSGMLAYTDTSLGLTAGDQTERICGEFVSANYFSALGIQTTKGLTLVAWGSSLGLIGCYWLSRLVSSQLYGVSPNDPATLVIAALVLIAVALIASYLPARRATKVDPLLALRYE
jgi:hypothetical protein